MSPTTNTVPDSTSATTKGILDFVDRLVAERREQNSSIELLTRKNTALSEECNSLKIFLELAEVKHSSITSDLQKSLAYPALRPGCYYGLSGREEKKWNCFKNDRIDLGPKTGRYTKPNIDLQKKFLKNLKRCAWAGGGGCPMSLHYLWNRRFFARISLILNCFAVRISLPQLRIRENICPVILWYDLELYVASHNVFGSLSICSKCWKKCSMSLFSSRK